MKSITIHGLDESLASLIEDEAQRRGTSQNKTIKALLEKALDISPSGKSDHRGDFEEFLGLWTDAEAAAFEEAIRDFEVIDAEDWQ